MKKLKKTKAPSRKDYYRNSGLWSVFKRDSSLTSSDKLAPLVLLRLPTLKVNRKVAYCCLLCTLRKLNCPSKVIRSTNNEKNIQGYTSLEVQIAVTILAQVYLVYTLSILHIVYERIHTIVTVLQIVHCYPIRIIRSSLSCYSCYLNIVTAQINLEPLIYIIVKSFPSSYKRPIWFQV